MHALHLLTALVAGVALAGSKGDLDAKDGFRDLKFGQRCSDIDGLVEAERLVENGFARVAYTRPTDKLSIGEAELTVLGYICYRDQLASVMVSTVGADNHRLILATLTSAYGEPVQAGTLMDWKGSKVHLSLGFDPYTEAVNALFTSLPMQQLRDADREAAAATATDDL